MILVSQTLALFLISTVGFTFLLLRNIQDQSLVDLSTASHVLDYAISSRQGETAAQAEAVAASTTVSTAAAARDHKTLAAALADYLSKHGLSSLTVTDASGGVLLRGEDPGRWGDSRSSDPLIRRGLVGDSSSSVQVHDGVVAPTVSLVASSPIRDAGGTIVGVAIVGRTISNAFVDGIRASTGLDSAVYGGNIRAATTLVASNGSDRAIGIKETSAAVNQQVLAKDKSYSGTLSLQNRPYLAAFAPLRDVNNVTVGMLLVARPTDALFAAANRSIQLTFLFVVVLVLVSVYPVYLVSRFLSRQLK
jgi:sensor histidine kinase regulating citrate/malate metabolism